MIIRNLIIAAVAAVVPAVAQGRSIAAADDAVQWHGRAIVTADSAVRFNFPGVAALLNFSGPELRMATSPGSGYFVVETDSLSPVKVQFTDADSVLTLVSGLPEGPHSARITYAIEGYEMKPEVRWFEAEEFLPAPERPKLKIEFIGNSITCGYGTEANDPKIRFSYDTENHTLTYACLTARALGAEANVVARSGIGVYRNYNGPREGNKEQTMPLEYEHTMLYVDSLPWDFSRFRPDIVCINLGTNDLSTSNYDINLYREAMGRFVDRVMALNPGAKIVLLTGAMMSGKELADARSALDSVAACRPGVYRFDMTPEDGSLGYGADYHPSAARARVMARELTEFLKTL